MTPAQRERLRVALRSVTGWSWSQVAACPSCMETPGREWWLTRENGLAPWPVSYLRNADGLDVELTAHATGRGWPERLAAEVGRVIRGAG